MAIKTKIKSALQQFSASLIIPIRILPIIGLLLAVSNLLTHPILLSGLPILENSIYMQFFSILTQALLEVLNHLGLLFAVGITVGLVHKEKAEAGFISLFVYLFFNFMMNELQAFDPGIFTGILLAIITAFVYNKWRDINLPQPFQVYSGTRFVSLVLLPVLVLLALGFSSISPIIQNGFNQIAKGMDYSSNIGLFIYGMLERLTIPSGLQNLISTPMLYTSLGGVEEVGGVVFEGARNIYFAEMVNPNVKVLSKSVLWDARGISKMFGLIGASLAMYHTAKPENKMQVRKKLLPIAITSFLSGITEPIEFSFLFAAPILFVVHSVLSGLSLVVLNLFNVRAIGPNGFLDFLLYNVPLGVEKTRWPIFIVVGLLFFVLYYVIFRFIITRFNLRTVGREDNSDEIQTNLKETNLGQTPLIVEALGGADNINTLTNCYSRLRLTVEDPSKVDEAVLKNQTGASGVMITDKNVHVVYGTQVGQIRQNVDQYLGRNEVEE